MAPPFQNKVPLSFTSSIPLFFFYRRLFDSHRTCCFKVTTAIFTVTSGVYEVRPRVRTSLNASQWNVLHLRFFFFFKETKTKPLKRGSEHGPTEVWDWSIKFINILTCFFSSICAYFKKLHVSIGFFKLSFHKEVICFKWVTRQETVVVY